MFRTVRPSSSVALAAAALALQASSIHADILLSEDFSADDGAFSQSSDGAPVFPWTYRAADTAWGTDGEENGTPTNHYLAAPAVTIPSPLDSAPVIRVTFAHRYSIETDWDAGALQLEVNGGGFTTVPNSDFQENGYTNTVPLQGTHALSGANGFTGDSPGVADGTSITSIVEIVGLAAGDELTFRFLAAFDQGAKGTVLPNWEISNVIIETLNDNDSDGIPNDYEEDYDFLDPENPADAAMDEEPDGLSNLDEYLRGTLPDNPDTDGDLLFDGIETGTGEWVDVDHRGTDPLDPDSDDDGLRDDVENHALPYDPANPTTQPGSDPNNPNTDGDFAPDGEEVAYNTDPTDPTDYPAFTEFLQFRYEFDVASADPLVDTSGKGLGNLATPTNGPAHRYGETSLVGGDGFSIGLDAPGDTHPTGSYLQVPDAPHPESFSFSIWIKPNYPGQQNPILSRENVWWPSPGAYYLMYVDGSGSLHWVTAQSEAIVTAPGTIIDQQIHHIVVTHLDTDGADTGQAERARLYIDGEMVGETMNPTEVPSLDAIADPNNIYLNIWVGTRSSGPGFKGDLDDFQYYSTELSGEQVAAMYASPGTIAPFGPGLPFKVTSISAVPNPEAGTDVTIEWNSKPSESYSIESWSASFGLWLEVIELIEGEERSTTTSHTFTQPDATEIMYRVVLFDDGE